MSFGINLAVIVLAYLVGSIPFGLLYVRVTTGKDIRKVESGRTGGTNAMRAAGFWVGFFTAISDILKGVTMTWLARWVAPDVPWMHVLAPLAAILGHNYSIFLIDRSDGRLRLRGGAGGAPCVGGSLGLWFPSILVIFPVGLLILYFVGYASLATLSAAVVSTIVFAYRAWIGASPWEYAAYGIFSGLLLAWALRPNIQRLMQGTERIVGFRARHKK